MAESVSERPEWPAVSVAPAVAGGVSAGAVSRPARREAVWSRGSRALGTVSRVTWIRDQAVHDQCSQLPAFRTQVTRIGYMFVDASAYEGACTKRCTLVPGALALVDWLGSARSDGDPTETRAAPTHPICRTGGPSSTRSRSPGTRRPRRRSSTTGRRTRLPSTRSNAS